MDQPFSFKQPFHFAFAFILLAVAGSAWAEEINLKGLVQDTSHNNLPGVTVKQEGAKAETLTDDRGEFTLKVDREDAEDIVLEFSKKGYLPLTFPVSKPEELVEPHLTPVIDDDGISAGTLTLPMTHAINRGVIAWLVENDRDKSDKTLDDGLYEELKKSSSFREQPPEQVRYRLRLPDNATKLKGAFLISEHGMGTNMMESKHLWDFADKNAYALVGFTGNPIQRGIYPASKLEEIVATIGKENGHPELSEVPFITFGHSNGTGFSAFYAALRPERTVCWISYHSGGSWHLEFPGVELSPGLVLHGTEDQFFKDQGDTVMKLRTTRNAPITMVMEYGIAHWPKDRDATYRLITDYCQACIDTRTRKGSNKLATPEEAMKEAWLGDVYDHAKGGFQKPAIAPWGDFQGDRKKSNFLPNEDFAKVWQRYRATGK